MGNSMKKPNNEIDEIKAAWERSTDEAVIRALNDDWYAYSAEAQTVINNEVTKRKLNIKTKPICGRHQETSLPLHMFLLKLAIFASPLILIAIADVGLWRYYEWRDNSVKKEINSLNIFLENEQALIKSAEKKLDELATKISKTRPESATNTMKDTELARQEYGTLYEEYEKRLEMYNTKVKEYNSLVKKVSSRRYVIPIPR
jgi:hypothetical protein